LPWRARESVTQPDPQRNQHKPQKGRAAKPASRHEGVEEGIVWGLRQIILELQGADAQRMIERHHRAEDVPPEPASLPGVILLHQTGALLEKIGNLIERQQADAIRIPPRTVTVAIRSRSTFDRVVT
jgi:hypothetical protein